ncbi:hypothetical protein LINPERPRIM_LOCUS16475 [Linum perenne]
MKNIPISDSHLPIMKDTKKISVSSTKLAVIEEEEEELISSPADPSVAADSSFSTPKTKECRIPDLSKSPMDRSTSTRKRYVSSPSALPKEIKKFQTTAMRQIFHSPEIEAPEVSNSLLPAETVRATPKLRSLTAPKYFR